MAETAKKKIWQQNQQKPNWTETVTVVHSSCCCLWVCNFLQFTISFLLKVIVSWFHKFLIQCVYLVTSAFSTGFVNVFVWIRNGASSNWWISHWSCKKHQSSTDDHTSQRMMRSTIKPLWHLRLTLVVRGGHFYYQETLSLQDLQEINLSHFRLATRPSGHV